MTKVLASLAVVGLLASLLAMSSPRLLAGGTGNGQICNAPTVCPEVPCSRMLGSDPPVYFDQVQTPHQRCTTGDGTCSNFGSLACAVKHYYTGSTCDPATMQPGAEYLMAVCCGV
ncbi:MAG: hypothetical protein IT208_16330 [Chthonomonadales bacterium]|nr:hypothetical protein [Chthonomonadales bacterium]